MDVITKRICKVWSHWGRGSNEWVEQKRSVVLVNWSWRKRKFPMVPCCFYTFFFFLNQVLESRRQPSAIIVEIYRPSPHFTPKPTGEMESRLYCGKILQCHQKYIQSVLQQSFSRVTWGICQDDRTPGKRKYLNCSRTVRRRIWADSDTRELKMPSKSWLE